MRLLPPDRPPPRPPLPPLPPLPPRLAPFPPLLLLLLLPPVRLVLLVLPSLPFLEPPRRDDIAGVCGLQRLVVVVVVVGDRRPICQCGRVSELECVVFVFVCA